MYATNLHLICIQMESIYAYMQRRQIDIDMFNVHVVYSCCLLLGWRARDEPNCLFDTFAAINARYLMLKHSIQQENN